MKSFVSVCVFAALALVAFAAEADAQFHNFNRGFNRHVVVRQRVIVANVVSPYVPSIAVAAPVYAQPVVAAPVAHACYDQASDLAAPTYNQFAFGQSCAPSYGAFGHLGAAVVNRNVFVVRNRGFFNGGNFFRPRVVIR